MARIDVGEVSMRVEDQGEGDPLLLINGIGAPLETWRPLVAHLENRRVITFDIPGSGQSPPLRQPVHMAAFADLVVRMMDGMKLSCVDVLGYSWGGALAQELAYRAPARLRRLVLAATVPGLGGAPPSPHVMTLAATHARAGSRWYVYETAPLVYGGETRHIDKRQLAGYLEPLLRCPPPTLGYVHQLFAISGWSSTNWLHRIPHRTLILSGDDDPLVPAGNARLLAHHIPEARLHIVRGGGHLFLLHQARTYAEMILRFLG